MAIDGEEAPPWIFGAGCLTTIHHFWEASHVVSNNEISTPALSRAAFVPSCRDDLPTGVFEFLGKLLNASLSETLIKARLVIFLSLSVSFTSFKLRLAIIV